MSLDAKLIYIYKLIYEPKVTYYDMLRCVNLASLKLIVPICTIL